MNHDDDRPSIGAVVGGLTGPVKRVLPDPFARYGRADATRSPLLSRLRDALPVPQYNERSDHRVRNGRNRSFGESPTALLGVRRETVNAGPTEVHQRQCGVCGACMLRRMSMHAIEQKEYRETLVWEDLTVDRFEDGAASGFKFRKLRRSLYESAIAGALQMDYLAKVLRSSASRADLTGRSPR